VSCCPEPITYYNRIDEIYVSNTSLYTTLNDSAIVNQDNYRIKCLIDEEIITQVFNFTPLIQSLYATSCEDNFVGLKMDIVRFEITCNKEIWNIQPRNLLDHNKIRVYKKWFTEDSKNQRMTIDEWLDILNNGGYQLAFEWYFEFMDKISSNDYLKFQILFELEDGTEYIIETKSIKFE